MTYTAEEFREAIKARTLPKERPTIAELEAILAMPDGPAVTINPDGTVGQGGDIVLAALRVAARVAEPGVIEEAMWHPSQQTCEETGARIRTALLQDNING